MNHRHNLQDLDLHMMTFTNGKNNNKGQHICFEDSKDQNGNEQSVRRARCGGELDLDANRGGALNPSNCVSDPVENIFWHEPPPGACASHAVRG